jgi:hypothetical protein
MIFLVLLVTAACATPPIRLSPRFAVGTVRNYRMHAEAVTAVDTGGDVRSERTVLDARSMIEVLSLSGADAKIRLTLTPSSFTRDGAAVSPPAEQKVELLAGPDGAIKEVLTVGGLPVSIAGADIADLAPIIGLPLPSQRVRVGAPVPRPTTSTAPPIYQGRVSGLRVINGHDCAIIDLGTRRPISRERELDGQQVRLDGGETAHSRIAFAFREGYAVDITTDAEGVFSLSGQGRVTIVTHTTLKLID